MALIRVLYGLVLVGSVLSQTENDLSNVQFNPRVQVLCTNSTMTVTVYTDEQYSGMLHVIDHRHEEMCRTIGTGLHTTVLRFGLNECGTSYVGPRRLYRNKVAIRFHHLVVLAQDQSFNVQCTPGSTNNTVTPVSGIKMEIFDKQKEGILPQVPVTSVYIDKTYVAQITIQRDLNSFHYWVKSCEATADRSDKRVMLIAEPGCSVDHALMTEFDFEHMGDKQLYRAAFLPFRIDDRHRIHITCIVIICQGTCPGINCSNPGYPSYLPGDSIREVLTAQSLYILEPGDRDPDAQPIVESKRCKWFDLLLGLCIALGILLLFTIILLLCIWPCESSRCCGKKKEEEKKEDIPEYFSTKDTTEWGSSIPFRFVPQYNSDSRESYDHDARSDITRDSVPHSLGSKSWHRAFSVQNTPVFTNYPVALPDGTTGNHIHMNGGPHSMNGYAHSQNGRSRPQSRYSSYAA